MFKYAINGIELDLQIISKLSIIEDAKSIFPEFSCVFQDTQGLFSEFNPIVHGSIFSIFRLEDEAREDFKITSVKKGVIENMVDSGSKYTSFEIKGVYTNPLRNLYDMGTIINRTSSSISVLKDIIENHLELRFVSVLEDDRNYDYYTLKVSIYNQLQMLIEQVNDSWRDKNAILYYTLFSNTITLGDISKLLEKNNAIASLTNDTILSSSVVNDYSIPTKKSISGYDSDEERFSNYDVNIDREFMNVDGDSVIYSNMIDEDLNNSVDFYMNNNSSNVIMNFTDLAFNLGKSVELLLPNTINSQYVSANKMTDGIYCIIYRAIIFTHKSQYKQSLVVSNPFLNKNK